MFAPLGATGEGIEQYTMVALDIPVRAQIAAIKRLLFQGQRDGWWEYEESCIGAAWQAAEPDQDPDRCTCGARTTSNGPEPC